MDRSSRPLSNQQERFKESLISSLREISDSKVEPWTVVILCTEENTWFEQVRFFPDKNGIVNIARQLEFTSEAGLQVAKKGVANNLPTMVHGLGAFCFDVERPELRSHAGMALNMVHHGARCLATSSLVHATYPISDYI